MYSIYDSTDTLKGMKDADILAERRERGPGWSDTAMGTLRGAAVGAVGGGALGLGLAAMKKGGLRANLSGRGLAKAGKYGAIVGGALAAAHALSKRSKEKKETNFYNDRLEYAQRQALRRERKDWKKNMTQRDGYSY